ncbi:conserved hypothetical protein [delta proteobacterium NaphS2]|nr:conserved hypothetical protein [delta proteobacterium NaphS2]
MDERKSRKRLKQEGEKMWIRKNTLLAQVMVVFAFLCFAAPGFALDPFAGRVLPTNKVSFYNDGKEVGQYTAEAPLPWNTLVKCDGRTAVRMDQMYVVFEDGSSFIISQSGGDQTLDLKTGTAYFALKTLPEGLIFNTPQAPVVTEMMALNAATGDQLLKGYVKVGESESELGVLEGGRLVVRTSDGQQTINPGQRIILAQSDLGGGGGASELVASLVVGGLVVGGSIAGFVSYQNSKDDNKEASPFTPQN